MSDIDSLPNVIKLARENAILGNYEDSLRHYLEGSTLIQNIIQTQTTRSSKDQWKLVESSLQQELNHVKELIKLNEGFSTNFGIGTKPGLNNEFKRAKTNTANMAVEIITPENNFIMKPPIPVPVQRKLPSFERFGGAEPFSHHKGGPDQYFGKDIDDYADEGQNYFVNQRHK